MAERTFSEEELSAAVAKAVADATAPLSAELDQLKAGQQTAEVEQRIADAVAEKQAEVDDLTGKLDEATIKAETADAARTELEEFWATAIAGQEAAEAAAARKDERLAQLREVASFPDDYLDEHADRFAAMGDDEFAERLEEYKRLSAKETTAVIPAATAFTAARVDPPAAAAATPAGSLLGEIPNLRRSLTDPRTL